LSTVANEIDECNVCYDIHTWQEILGHCSYDDVLKLESVTDGIKVRGKIDRSNLKCEVCVKGQFSQNRNRYVEEKAEDVFALVHADLAGPIEAAGKDGFRFGLAFTDNYSGAVFTYFLKSKSDTTIATEKFIADVAPYGKINVEDQIMEHSLHLIYFRHCSAKML